MLDDIPVLIAVNMDVILEMLEEQETFLNIDAELDLTLYLIFLSAKCLVATHGTNHLISPQMTKTFVIGTFINACINLTSWFVPAFSFIFGAAIFKLLADVDTATPLRTFLYWVSFCVRIECEFYLDIYVVLCVSGFIFKMYGEEYHKSLALLFSMMGIYFIFDHEKMFVTGNVLFLLGYYVLSFFLFRPPNDDWSYPYGRRCYYYYLNFVLFLVLFWKYCTIALDKGYINSPLHIFWMGFDDIYSYLNQSSDLSDIFEIFEKFRKLQLALLQPKSAVEEITVNLSSRSSVKAMPSFRM